MSTLSERISHRLAVLGTNAFTASRQAGLGDSAIRDILSGKSKSPSLATIEALCVSLECDLAYLVGIPAGGGETETLEKFWMVHGMGQGVPRCHHFTKNSAQVEARRLARVYPGITFVVLASVDAFVADVPEARSVVIVRPIPGPDADENIPF